MCFVGIFFFAAFACLYAFALQWPLIIVVFLGRRDGQGMAITEGGCHSPHAVEAIVGAINGQHRSPCVRLCHAPIPLENDHFGPDFVVDLGPLVQHFLNVFL